jgi:hypothetical protein
MSSTSLPLVTCIPISLPPPSPSLLSVSAPDNTPVHTLSPQLAQCTEPLPILEDVDDCYGRLAIVSDVDDGGLP